MKNYIWFVALVFPLKAVFDYDRAVSVAQKGEWDEASRLIYGIADSPEVLYDKGVIYYKQKDYKNACEHFVKAADHSDASEQVKETSRFNAGSCAVALGDKQKAIAHFEQVLHINPSNEFARHNIGLLKEQEKKEDEKKQKEKEQQKDKEKNENKENKDSGKKEQDKKSKHDKGEQEDAQQQEVEKRDSGEQQKEKSSQKKENEQQENGMNERKREQAKQEQKEQEQGSEEKSQKNEQNKQENSQTGAGGEKNKGEQMGGKSKQATLKQKEEEQQDPWVAQVLSEIEKRDAYANKQMMRGMVAQEMAEHGEQNSW